MSFYTKIVLVLILFLPFFSPATERQREEYSGLSEFRNYMLREINFLRTNPDEYAEKRLRQERENSTDNGAYAFLRKAKPVRALKFSEKLNSIALQYAQFMSRRNKFSHTANGTPFSRARRAGYNFMAMGENIACGNEPQLNAFENPEAAAIGFVRMLVIDKGVQGEGHRHNLMSTLYVSVGIGFGHNPRSYCVNYIVQDFGTP